MQPLITGLAFSSLVLDGILCGLSLDKVIVQLPARGRMGPVGYAGYARSADLGNGVAFYGSVGISAALLTIAAFAGSMIRGGGPGLTWPLGIAAGLSVVHSAVTARAARTMFRIGRAEDAASALAPLLDRFAAWSRIRAAAQLATFVSVAVAIAVTR